MATTLVTPARAALLPRTARSSSRVSHTIKTSATSKKQGSSDSQVAVKKQAEGQQQQHQQSAVARTPAWQSTTPLPRASAGLLPLGDYGMLTPTFGRVGGLLRSIEQEMDSMLQVDIEDKKDEILIKADTPGLTGNDIHVGFDPETRLLTLSGERREEKEEEDEDTGYVRMERRFGHFQRCFRLPTNVIGDKISAKVAHGVLNVHVPKTESAKTKEKKIEVETHQ